MQAPLPITKAIAFVFGGRDPRLAGQDANIPPRFIARVQPMYFPQLSQIPHPPPVSKEQAQMVRVLTSTTPKRKHRAVVNGRRKLGAGPPPSPRPHKLYCELANGNDCAPSASKN